MRDGERFFAELPPAEPECPNCGNPGGHNKTVSPAGESSRFSCNRCGHSWIVPYDPPLGPFDTRPVTVTDADLWPDNVVHLEDEEAWHPGEEGQ